MFGGKAAFGQPNATAASIFGGGAAAFGQKPANNFWSGGSGNTEGGFGATTGGFGKELSCLLKDLITYLFVRMI